jgi:NAD(P)-dependent dehydrogenase (short-subunit alcohol dehydrogenase family)
MFMNEGTMKLFRPDLDNPVTQTTSRSPRSSCTCYRSAGFEPVDISNAVLFLASDESRYITGLPVTVDAGSMLK